LKNFDSSDVLNVLNDLNYLNAQAVPALSASVIREILGQPLVPRFIDGANGAHLRVRAGAALHQSGDSQVDAGKVWIGAKMIAHHDNAFAGKFGKGRLERFRREPGTREGSGKLSDDARLFSPAL
jgi:hypothetical protein